jgi:hypothetical protein
MGTYVGLDVSLKTTCVCVLGDGGSAVFEGKVATEPAARFCQHSRHRHRNEQLRRYRGPSLSSFLRAERTVRNKIVPKWSLARMLTEPAGLHEAVLCPTAFGALEAIGPSRSDDNGPALLLRSVLSFELGFAEPLLKLHRVTSHC